MKFKSFQNFKNMFNDLNSILWEKGRIRIRIQIRNCDADPEQWFEEF